MKRFAWILWLLLIHLAAGALLYQNRARFGFGDTPLADNRPPPHYRYLRRAHASIDPFVDSGAVVFIGDSHVEGLNTSAVIANAVNYGISNDTTTGVLARIDDYQSLERASLVLLAIGVNDLVAREADAVVADYQRIVQRILPRAPLLLSLVLPVDEASGWPGLNTRITSLNQRIAAFASDLPGIAILDLSAEFADAEGNLRDDLHLDGVHLSETGYRRWINALQAAIIRNSITK